MTFKTFTHNVWKWYVVVCLDLIPKSVHNAMAKAWLILPSVLPFLCLGIDLSWFMTTYIDITKFEIKKINSNDLKRVTKQHAF